MAAKTIRLDQLLVSRGLAESRSKAQALIIAGSVRVNGQPRTKPGEAIRAEALVEIVQSLPYASRGGYKLAHALDRFALHPTGLVALDVGASTGGFTDVLLQRGATHVYAVDVGYGLLDWKLRQDPRVTTLDRTNIRHLEALPNGTLAQCATVDVAFISLRLVLPAILRLLTADAWLVVLIKPQFEAGVEDVGKGGVVRDRAVHTRVLREVLSAAVALGKPARGLTRSPITGPAGNIEFLAWLDTPNADTRVLREVLGAAAALGKPARGLTRSPITGPAGNIEFLAWLDTPNADTSFDSEQTIAEATLPMV